MKRENVERLARMGNSHAMCSLGKMCLNEAVRGGDPAVAAKWFHQAALRGVAEAQYQLATLYMRGLGVPEDVSEAIKWFTRAAEQGVADAVDYLGNIYFIGLGVSPDAKKAKKWLARGVELLSRKKEIDRQSGNPLIHATC